MVKIRSKSALLGLAFSMSLVALQFYSVVTSALTITSLSTTSGDAAGGYSITIRGTGFTETSKIPGKLKQVAAGNQYTLALSDSGQVFAWGDNSRGQLSPQLKQQAINQPTEITDQIGLKSGEKVTTISADGYHSSVTTNKNRSIDWGGNKGDRINVPSSINDQSVISSAAGSSSFIALTADNKVYAQGSNSYGQLGDNKAEANTASPIEITNQFSEADKITSVSGNDTSFYAVAKNGNAYSWGTNDFGQLGTDVTNDYNVPNKFATNIASISASGYHTAAITKNGTLQSWGWNTRGQLGIGNYEVQRNTPVAIDLSLNPTTSTNAVVDKVLFGNAEASDIQVIDNSTATATVPTGTPGAQVPVIIITTSGNRTIANTKFAYNTPEVKKYTVTFDSDGGSIVPSQTVEEGKTATAPKAPVKDGYTFEKWLLVDNSGNTTEYSFSSPMHSNIKLIAKYIKNSAPTLPITPDSTETGTQHPDKTTPQAASTPKNIQSRGLPKAPSAGLGKKILLSPITTLALGIVMAGCIYVLTGGKLNPLKAFQNGRLKLMIAIIISGLTVAIAPITNALDMPTTTSAPTYTGFQKIEDPGKSSKNYFQPTWFSNDRDGEGAHHIQAHGGQIVPTTENGQKVYYWYGESHEYGYGNSPGVHVYKSTDLYNWKDMGIALATVSSKAQLTDKSNKDYSYFDQVYDLSSHADRADKIFPYLNTNSDQNHDGKTDSLSAIIERPKVIYNPATEQWVMWFHSDGSTSVGGSNYSRALLGVAVSSTPAGPFRLVGAYRGFSDGKNDGGWGGNGDSRDMTVYAASDGNAYVGYSSEGNTASYVAKLDSTWTHLNKTTNVDQSDIKMQYSEDGKYTDITGGTSGKDYKVIANDKREAISFMEYGGVAYAVTSGTTGWNPNIHNAYVSTNGMLGDWKSQQWGEQKLGRITRDMSNETNFGSQIASILPINASDKEFLYIGDRWNSGSGASTYVFLPLKIHDDKTLELVNPGSAWDLNWWKNNK